MQNSIQKQDKTKKFRAVIIDGKRMRISMHEFNPFKDRFVISEPARNKDRPFYMTKREYVGQLKRQYKKLFFRRYDNALQSYFLTLTFNSDMSILQAQKHFHTFRIELERACGKFEYARTIEFFQDGKSLHIHAVIMFYDDKLFNDFRIYELWKYGIAHSRQIYDIYGVLEYITKYKDSNIQSDDYTTYYPSGTKIITTSRNFGTSSIDKKTVYLTESQIKKIMYDYNGFIRQDGHNYTCDFDRKGLIKRHCVDTLYIKNIDDIPDLDIPE